MDNREAVELGVRFKKMAQKFSRDRGFLPNSVDVDDLVQEAYMEALELSGKFKHDGAASFSTYISRPVMGRFSECVAKNTYGPSASMRWLNHKNGKDIDYGEASIEVLAGGDSSEWLESNSADDAITEVSFFSLTMQEATDCLIDIRRQLKNITESGISYAKTRNKWHVEVVVSGRKQFVGQFPNSQLAACAKKEFLESFMDAVLASIEEAE